jgi:hypothetical protein
MELKRFYKILKALNKGSEAWCEIVELGLESYKFKMRGLKSRKEGDIT